MACLRLCRAIIDAHGATISSVTPESQGAPFRITLPLGHVVMALVVEGLTNKQIAGALNLSEVTVKIHRGRMMKKMETRTLADLVRAAVDLGMSSRA